MRPRLIERFMRIRFAAMAFWVACIAGVSPSMAQPPVPVPVTTQRDDAPVAQVGASNRAGVALVIGNSRYTQGELPSVVTDRL